MFFPLFFDNASALFEFSAGIEFRVINIAQVLKLSVFKSRTDISEFGFRLKDQLSEVQENRKYLTFVFGGCGRLCFSMQK